MKKQDSRVGRRGGWYEKTSKFGAAARSAVSGKKRIVRQKGMIGDEKAAAEKEKEPEATSRLPTPLIYRVKTSKYASPTTCLG